MECCRNMVHDVTSVIKDNIRRAKFIGHTFKECRVLLLTDANLDLILLKTLAVLVVINPDDCSMGTKIALPHLERTTCSTADFNKGNRFIYPILEMTFINRKVMLPLEDLALVVR